MDWDTIITWLIILFALVYLVLRFFKKSSSCTSCSSCPSKPKCADSNTFVMQKQNIEINRDNNDAIQKKR